MHQLEGKTREVIDQYLSLPFGAKPSCPYFINKRRNIRSQLRVLKGKGSPREIAEEATIDALHMRLDPASLSTDKAKEFLVKQSLGIDCSGLAYHILDAYAREKKNKSLRSFVKSNRKGFIGLLLARLRPAENMGVATFANDRNSFSLPASKAEPGDFIVFLGTEKEPLHNHMMIITGVEKTEGDTRMSYVHSYSWPSEGLYGHGVREGNILVHGIGDTDDLLQGTWKEKGEVGAGNYTFESARNAKELSIRRLKNL